MSAVYLDQENGAEIQVMPHPNGNIVIGQYDMSMKDFCDMAMYVLINTDLEANDPRLEFVEEVKAMREMPGYNPGRRRLAIYH